MNETAIYELLLSQQKQIRELHLHLEALKRMMFEHRPLFVPAFEHQLGAVEASSLLCEIDEAIGLLERQIKDSRKQ
jgi:predicted DNA-binding transcriptional regulator